MNSRQIVLASRPRGVPSIDNFRFEDIELEEIKTGEALLKPQYISVDPYMRGRMNDVKSYTPPFQIGQPIAGGTVAEVIESKHTSLIKGDIVYGNLPWATSLITNGDHVRKIDTKAAPSSYYLGLLGMPGLTAYFGIMDIGKPKSGETVLVSGAAGAVGLVAGQIAKLHGARIVGIAGSDEKCNLLKTKFGFDETINYKTAKNLKKSILAACQTGVDVYFDNVGGKITDAAILNLNFHSRIVLCGQISLYNETEMPVGPSILPRLLTRSVMLQGFIVSNYISRFDEGLTRLSKWHTEGKIEYAETIVKGFEKLPETFLGLFSGTNLGKMVIEV